MSKAKISKANDNQFSEYLMDLQQMEVRHTLKSCSSSNTILVEGGRKYFFPNGERIDPQHLNFIKKVKKEVCDRAIDLNLTDKSPKFIRFSPLFYDDFFRTDFVEIDISGAYWFTAYDFDLISEATYLQGLTVPKRVRLMALGAAATTKDVLYFDGKQYEHKGTEFDQYGRLAFFAVAKRVDEIMSHALDMLHGNAAFYWVDALFVKKSFADWAIENIQGFGYEVKETPLLWLKGDATTKSITGCRDLGQRVLRNGHRVACWEFKTYFRPQKIRNNNA